MRVTATAWKRPAALLLGLAFLCVPGFGRAESSYNVASLCDFSGPHADIMRPLAEGRHVTIDWWNAEVGAELGVRLNYKTYDIRYDAAQAATQWPQILAKLDPIAILGLGGPDAAALQERLHDDQVTMFLSTAAYGFSWKPNPWLFNPRPTYTHEAAAFLEWYRRQRGGDAPLKFAVVSSEASPAYVDMAKGLQAYSGHCGTLKLVETAFTQMQPTDLTAQVRRIVQAGAEVITVQTNTSMVVAAKRALRSVGRKIPLMLSSHDGLPASAKAVGGMEEMEGDYESYAMAMATGEPGPSFDFYSLLKQRYGLKAEWNVLAVMGIGQGLFLVRTVENAARRVGPDRITGKALREALLSAPIPSNRTFGYLSDLRFTSDAPFPVPQGLTVRVGTVSGGRYRVAATAVPVPAIDRW